MCRFSFNFTSRDASKKFEYEGLSWMVIEPTSLCNHNCVYCYSRSAASEEKEKLCAYSLEEIDLILNNAKKAGVKQVSILGGEPLLYPDIVSLVSKCKDFGFIVHLATNGFNANEVLIEKLATAGLTQAQINIDHIDPKIHDSIRGKEKSFEKAKSAVDLFKKNNIYVVLVSLLLKTNQDVIGDLFHLAKKWGCDGYRVWDFIPTPNNVNNHKKLSLSREEYVRAVETLMKQAHGACQSISTFDPVMPALFEHNHCLKQYKEHVTFYGCPMHKKRFYHVSFNREINMCCMHRSHLGKFNDFVPNLFNRIGTDFFVTSREVCKTCNFEYVCQGGCPSRAIKVSETLNQDSRCPLEQNRFEND